MSPGRTARRGAGAGLLLAAWLTGGEVRADPSCGDQVHQDQCGGPNIYPCCDNGGNCTWWAWESVCRNWHIALVNWGNANTWVSHAAADPNFDVLSTPVVGSIATRTLGTYGHVAWVIGVNGGTVTVSEENCCGSCAPGLRIHDYAAGYFNGGYVVRHATCECSPGAAQSEACGDCGSRSRGCDAACKWGGWSGCAGPDPNGGSEVCDTGAPGVCSDGRVRCVEGIIACRALVEPSPEVCDGLDNDCNDKIDDGNPPIGVTPPEYAATLVDLSHPQSLRSGERALVWADFRNDGAAPWGVDEVWLIAHGAADGAPSAFSAPGLWRAWNVAAALTTPVLPGDNGRFAFEVIGPAGVEGRVEERFQLQAPGSKLVGCPDAELPVSIQIVPAASGSVEPSSGASSGCSLAHRDGGKGWGGGIAMALLGLLRVRRARRTRPGPQQATSALQAWRNGR